MTTAVAVSPALNVKRYPFPVPEWVRTIWASEQAREVWEPRLQAIGVAWESTERASVGIVRDACLQMVSPEQLPALNQKAAERGLELLVLGQQGVGGSYQARPVAVKDAPSWGYRVALTTRAAAVDFLAAWRDSDDERIGELLGFPPCCREFFQQTWVQGRWMDTTWPMVAAGATGHQATVSGPVECNILLRWLGVRWIPHLPCSFECEATAAFGQRMRDVMSRGFPAEAAWMDELLDSPVEWSSWHGIAEIKTPVVTVSAKTDATAEKLVVRRKGSTYPEAGARGLRFPYHRDPDSLRPQFGLSQIADSEKGGGEVVQHEVQYVDGGAVITLYNSEYWLDNGFASLGAMEAAHRMLLSEVSADYGTVVDLGCGNGLMLSQVFAQRRIGIESDPDRAARAQERLDCVIVGDCTDAALIAAIIEQERPDVLIAQRYRNPPETLPDGVRVLSYSYESDDMGATWR